MNLYIYLLLILTKICHCFEVDISNYSKKSPIPQFAENLIPSDDSSSDTIKIIDASPNSALEPDAELNLSVESFKPSDGSLAAKIIDISNLGQDYVIDNINESNDSSSDTIDLIEASPNSELEADTELNLSDLNEEDSIGNKEDDIGNKIDEDTQDSVSNSAIAQWVAAIIFSAILIYVILFIIHVAILECKGRGRRTIDDDKIGSFSEEKQKLLNGAVLSDNTQEYYPIDEFENCNKGYTEVDLSLENSSDRTSRDGRTDLHHLMGSPVAEVEVFTHDTLRLPANKGGCLQFQNDIIT